MAPLLRQVEIGQGRQVSRGGRTPALDDVPLACLHPRGTSKGWQERGARKAGACEACRRTLRPLCLPGAEGVAVDDAVGAQPHIAVAVWDGAHLAVPEGGLPGHARAAKACGEGGGHPQAVQHGLAKTGAPTLPAPVNSCSSGTCTCRTFAPACCRCSLCVQTLVHHSGACCTQNWQGRRGLCRSSVSNARHTLRLTVVAHGTHRPGGVGAMPGII